MLRHTIAATIQSHDLETAEIAFRFEQAAIAIRIAIRALYVILESLTLAITEERDPRGETAAGEQAKGDQAQAGRYTHYSSRQVSREDLMALR